MIEPPTQQERDAARALLRSIDILASFYRFPENMPPRIMQIARNLDNELYRVRNELTVIIEFR